MKTLSITALLIFGINFIPKAQSKPAADSVVINVGTASKITILIRDKKDLEYMQRKSESNKISSLEMMTLNRSCQKSLLLLKNLLKSTSLSFMLIN